MGGVNFTRNRAWWHTAIWDEYNQRHQYLMIIPTFMIMIPYYWHGSFLNRDLEQNFAAKMYSLDYEQRRNRLTHNLIMEHFETHVESVQDVLDEIKQNGFEETFKDQIENGLFTEFPAEKTGGEDIESWSKDKKAEWYELHYIHEYQNQLVDHGGFSLEKRLSILNEYPRRKYPGTPFKFLYDVPLSYSLEAVKHVSYTPELSLPEDQMKEIKLAGAGEAEDEE